jgi:hypothetical protein
VDYQYVYRVSRFLHPLEPSSLAAYPSRETPPVGYTEFLTELGIGTICHGLQILTPDGGDRFWSEYKLNNYFINWSSHFWSTGLFVPADVAECQLIAQRRRKRLVRDVQTTWK